MDHEAQDVAFQTRAFGVMGTAPGMQPVLRLISQAASNGRAVLICGETGSGRGRIARSIHAVAGAPPDAFVALDCTGTAGEDLEDQLFGPDRRSHARHAAFGETLSSTSLLWRANGGTLYLANVVDASAPVQARLARLMRDREVIAPDGSRLRIECRMIASVDPDVEHALAEGRLRRDLYARLASVVISVPALRDRKEDIPDLARFFLEEYATTSGIEPKELAPAAALLLQALPWQGNTWELRGLVESLAQRVPGPTIGLAEVLANVRLDPNARSVAVGGTLRAARRRFEREYILTVLQQFRGQMPRAARVLGIQRTNLYRKMRTLGLTRAGRSSPPR